MIKYYETKDFRYTLKDGTIEIIKFKFNYGFSRNLVIPSYIDSYPVTSIGNDAFARSYNDDKLESVTIPEGVTSIGNYAFLSNKLTSVIIPESVTSIGYGAFMNNQLTSITLSESVKGIASEAFKSNRLKSITNIGERAGSKNHSSSVTIPDSITYIEKQAFENNKITEIQIPDSVIHISKSAFFDNQLEMIVIGEHVESIEDDAFSYQNDRYTETLILGDKTRFNERWEQIGFPKKQMPVEEKKASENKNIKERLKKLKELLEEDLISEEDYNKRKEEVLKDI